MKRTVLLILAAAALLLSLAGCASSENPLDENKSEVQAPGEAFLSPMSPDMAEGGWNVAMDAADPAWDGMSEPDWNTEEYSAIQENGFKAVALSPLSTLSADVDTASYANLRRMLLRGETVPADAVRIEEMLNYFRYDYPEPEGDEPFSVSTEIAPCPWNADTKLLRIGLQTAQPDWDSMPASNLVFLIDVSGSMEEYDKLPLVKQAFLLLTENLRPDDVISIVTYASDDRVVLAGASGDEAERIQTAIEDLTAGGSTAGSKGIQTAYALAEAHFIEGGNNRVILATDGDLNVGITSEGELTDLIEEKRESGVFLSVMGFGTGNLKDNKMEALANNGNGNYSYIDSVLEAKRVLVEEMGGTLFTVAKDVKLQVEFNPARLKGYRLIGYENRLLNAEDFSDDTKDAGEIGAGHRLTVLYELVPADSDMEVPGAELKYQDAMPTGSTEWLTVSIRYKAPDGDASELREYPVDDGAVVERASQDTLFAASVAQFGMLLRNSGYAGTTTYESLTAQLEALDLQGDSYKEELLYLVRQAALRAG